jgi:hypothetical protein
VNLTGPGQSVSEGSAAACHPGCEGAVSANLRFKLEDNIKSLLTQCIKDVAGVKKRMYFNFNQLFRKGGPLEDAFCFDIPGPARHGRAEFCG